MTEEEKNAFRQEYFGQMTEEELTLVRELYRHMNEYAYATADMPEGTITTEPYFSDVFVPVELAVEGQQ